MAGKSEVYHWLKSLSPGMKLERLSLEFESRGFRSRRSLAYVKSEDLDSFFLSPDKLLLAEGRVLEAELSNIKAESGHQFNPNHLEPRRLNMTPTTATGSAPQQQSPEAAINISFEASTTTSNQSPQTIQSPLDQRAAKLTKSKATRSAS